MTEAERFVLVSLLTETIKPSHYPLSPRMQTLRAILVKLGWPSRRSRRNDQVAEILAGAVGGCLRASPRRLVK